MASAELAKGLAVSRGGWLTERPIVRGHGNTRPPIEASWRKHSLSHDVAHRVSNPGTVARDSNPPSQAHYGRAPDFCSALSRSKNASAGATRQRRLVAWPHRRDRRLEAGKMG